jgi:uncharacterized protein YukE
MVVSETEGWHMAFEGMDPAQVRSLASAMGSAADSLTAAADQLDAELSRSAWKGPDSAQFRSQWTSSHRTALRNTAESLRQVRKVLAKQADDQDLTSQAGDGLAGGAGGAGGGHRGSSRGGGADTQGAGDDDIWSQLATVPRTLTGLVPGLQGLIGDVGDLVMGAPVGGLITAGLGFQYVKGQDFYTTNQTSIQSHLGFMDAFDDAGFAGGMDLDDNTSTFEYGGREYRLELWKGSYGAGSAFGGEVGLYIRDPSKNVSQSPGQAIDGFYPAADPADRIHMVQTIYNVHTGEDYFTSDGHDTLGEDQYWNAAIRTTPGIEKDDLGQRGTLYVDDPGLLDAMSAEMRRQGLDVDVDRTNGTISYDWK